MFHEPCRFMKPPTSGGQHRTQLSRFCFRQQQEHRMDLT